MLPSCRIVVFAWHLCILCALVRSEDDVHETEEIKESRVQACVKILYLQAESQLEAQDAFEDVSHELNISLKEAQLHLINSFWESPDEHMKSMIMGCYSSITDDQVQSALAGDALSTEVERLMTPTNNRTSNWTHEHHGIVNSTFRSWLSSLNSSSHNHTSFHIQEVISEVLTRRQRVWACLNIYSANASKSAKVRTAAKSYVKETGIELGKAVSTMIWQNWNPDDEETQGKLVNCVVKISENTTARVNMGQESAFGHSDLLDSKGENLLDKWSAAHHRVAIQLMSRIFPDSSRNVDGSLDDDFDPELAVEEDKIEKVEL